MNSGFRNIYLAALRLDKYSATIYLDFKESLLSIRRSNLLNMMQRLKLPAEHSKHKHPKSWQCTVNELTTSGHSDTPPPNLD